MVELVVEVGSVRQMLGVVVMAHVGIINHTPSRLHQGTQAVAEGRRGLRTALLLGLRLAAGRNGGALGGILGCRQVLSRTAWWVGAFSYLHLVEVSLKTQALRLLLQEHPLLVQPVKDTKP